jgi:putative FmdB family regulatory protein
MPIFEYRCQKCEQNFEVLVRANESVECPQCHAANLQKLVSAPAGHVRGSTSLPQLNSCPPANAPPCSPHCCRLQ